jgi:excisionase family DNA binding protein
MMLTPADVAQRLHCSERFVRDLLRRDLPHIRVSDRHRLVDEDDLAAWMEQKKVNRNKGGTA